MRGTGQRTDAKPDGDTTFDRSYEIRRFGDRMISIEIFESHESYFGHGWRAEYTINWDMRRNRPLRASDRWSACRRMPRSLTTSCSRSFGRMRRWRLLSGSRVGLVSRAAPSREVPVSSNHHMPLLGGKCNPS
jgi:hypothetical protein